MRTTSMVLQVNSYSKYDLNSLTHWGRVTHICVSKLTIIGSHNDLSPGRRQAIIWTNAGILLTGSLGRNFSEFLIEILTVSFKKMHLKISSANWRPFCLGLNMLINTNATMPSSGTISTIMSWHGTPLSDLPAFYKWNPSHLSLVDSFTMGQ